MIRPAERRDFPWIFPLLEQIFDEMDLDTVKALPADQFYDLLRLGFYSDHYRYSRCRCWVEVNSDGRPLGVIVLYGYDAQDVIDASLKQAFPKVGLPLDTIVFAGKEALPHEWYIDALAVDPAAWGQGIGTKLLQFADELGRQRGFKKISLNVDLDNPRSARLYEHLGFRTTGKMTIGDRTYAHMVKAI